MSRYRSDEATSDVWTEDGRIYLKWRSQAYWDDIRQSLKAHFRRHGDLSFSGTRKHWSVPGWRRSDLYYWLHWTFESSCITWLDEAPHNRTYGQRAYGSYRAQDTAVSTLDAAYAALHLRPSAPLWAAEAVYRAAVKVHHPDAGGSHELAVGVNRAIETIRHHQPKETHS